MVCPGLQHVQQPEAHPRRDAVAGDAGARSRMEYHASTPSSFVIGCAHSAWRANSVPHAGKEG